MTEISELIAENVPIILIQLFDLVLVLYNLTSTFIPQRRGTTSTEQGVRRSGALHRNSGIE
jgi:hypothetical protein